MDTLHDIVKEQVLIAARIRDGRITRLPAAVRHCRRRGALRQVVMRAAGELDRRTLKDVPTRWRAHPDIWARYKRIASAVYFDSRGVIRGDELRAVAHYLSENHSLASHDAIGVDLPGFVDVPHVDGCGWIHTDRGMRWYGWMRSRGFLR